MASPILDLSYRNYDGPLEPPVHRWWAIAKMSMRLAIKKKGFWVWSAISGYWYAILLIIFYFIDLSSPLTLVPNQKNPFMANILWKAQFLNAFMVAQLFMFILALLLGAGSIANDNRANALLVYLSKPCSKLDYVIGKWVGIFVPISIVSAAPTLLFYVYCLLSYRSYDFVAQDPWLILRLLAMVLIPGFFHASVSLGISSLFQQGRLAGATYAGLYFFGYFFTIAMQVIIISGRENEWRGIGTGAPKAVQNLYYCSVDGVQIAMAKIILNTDGRPPVEQPPPPQLLEEATQQLATQQPAPRRAGSAGQLRGQTGQGGGRSAADRFMDMQRVGVVPEPSPLIFFPAFFGICGLFILLAWSKIRAVEVVG